MKRRFLAALMLVLGPGPAVAAEPAPGFVPIDLSIRPVERFPISGDRSQFGELEFRGGIDISSSYPHFGSLSGLAVTGDGTRLIAVADTGFWFTCRLVLQGGRLVGANEGRMAPMLGADGRLLGGKRVSDAEGLRLQTRDGRAVALVAFEQTNDIRLFPVEPDLALARPQNVPLPATMKGLKTNQGLETVAVAPSDGPLSGSVIAIAERSLDRSGNHRGWIFSGPRAGAFTLRRSDDFDITDGDFMPNGDLLVLERRFSIGAGVAMRMRRIPAEALKPGALVDGPVVIAADMANQIDNMEGLSVGRAENGETIITIVSDDNHSLLQRTLLLRFAWHQPQLPMPRPRPAI